ncbi:MFS transporter [uncultured Halopseudomonas sp.]|uniref:MFS transporter n=1 Tax=uncultured Halopseudomonas sp. TaxID=2901193 RepID=UPI0030ECD9F3|tara:strand:- start:10751 stop:12064 length:1314 start_codon:yes stop_codon:yes gene_type:complete
MALQPDMDQLYDQLVEEEDTRVCKDIPESACSNVPANFFRQVAAIVLTGLGDTLTNPKTTLTWLLGIVGAPAAMIAWLVPIRESGSMLPQMFIASFIRRQALRKPLWVAGSLGQAAALLAMGAAAWLTEGLLAGLLILGCLVLFSLARSVCSVAIKDVMGKTIPKTRRGRMHGMATTVSGTLVLAFGVYMMLLPPADDDVLFYALLLVGAAMLWVGAAILFQRVEETPGATEGGANAINEAISRISLLRDDAPFRRFVITRALLLCSALSAPYYVVLGQEVESSLGMLGAFLVANGLANSLSAMIWGRMADLSSKQVLTRAGLLTSLVALPVVGLHWWADLPANVHAWLFPVAFFVLGIAHAGVRVGRKTYVLDMAGGNKRTDYVALSNSLIGLLLLSTGFLGLLTALIGPGGMLLLLSGLGLCGVLMSLGLDEVQS